MKYYLSVATLFLMGTLPIFAQAVAEAGGETAPSEMTMISLLVRGGWIMGVLGLLSVLTVFLVLLYLLTIRRSAVVTNKFMNASEAMIRRKDYLGLIAYCHRRNESIARITGKTLDFLTKNPTATHQDIREVAEAEASRQAGMFTQRISYLADLASIAPMVGLLGTVIGMIKSFMDISQGNFEGVKQLEMASGVWEALITTAGGLSIGIVAIAFYSLFRGRVQRIIAELESASTHVLAIIGGQLNSKTISYQDENNAPSPMRQARGE